MKGLGYLRVSTREQGDSALGLEAQKEAIENFAKNEGIEIVGFVTEVASAKGSHRNRPELCKAIELCRKEKCALIVSKLDRLTRDLESVGSIINDNSFRLIVAQFGLAADNTMLGFYGVMAQAERDFISKRTREGLQAKKNREGYEKKLNPRLAEVGLNGTAEVKKIANNFAESMRKTLTGFKLQKLSYSAIARELMQLKIKAANGGDKWSPQQVKNIMLRLGIAY